MHEQRIADERRGRRPRPWDADEATVLGGTGYLVGPVVGAFAFVALEELALRSVRYHQFVLGVALVAVVLVFPGGIVGTVGRLARRPRRSRRVARVRAGG